MQVRGGGEFEPGRRIARRRFLVTAITQRAGFPAFSTILAPTHLMFVDADISSSPTSSCDCCGSTRISRRRLSLKQIDWRALPRRAVNGEPLAAPGSLMSGRFARATSFAMRPASPPQICRHGVSADSSAMCFEKLIAAHPNSSHERSTRSPMRRVERPIFMPCLNALIERESGAYLRDYAFCGRWRALGRRDMASLHSKLTMRQITF